MDFATLKSRLLAEIGRAPADLCYELVTAEINEGLRIADMQTTVTFTVTDSYTLPTDFLEAVSVYSVESGDRRDIMAVEPATFDAQWRVSAYPHMYSISDGEMRINGTEGGGDITLRYYQEQADLSADADTNAILTKHPSIYVYGVLAHHAALKRDQTALTVHFQAYERAMSKVRQADIARRTGGLVSSPRKRTAP